MDLSNYCRCSSLQLFSLACKIKKKLYQLTVYTQKSIFPNLGQPMDLSNHWRCSSLQLISLACKINHISQQYSLGLYSSLIFPILGHLVDISYHCRCSSWQLILLACMFKKTSKEISAYSVTYVQTQSYFKSN